MQEVGLAVALVVAFVIFAATAPNFLTPGNQINVLRQASFTGIIALGMTLVIVAAEIDISVGALVALTSALVGVFFRGFDMPIGAIVILVLVIATATGTFSGLVRAYLNVPSIIVTLALFLALRGAAEFITDASPIAVSDPFMERVLAGTIYGLPTPVLIFAVLTAIFVFMTRRTVFGRQIYAVGGNAAAARAAGLPVERVRVLVFAITGFLAGITGILLTARVGSGTSSIGNGLEFEVIAAVIIGGTALTGGRGSILGTVLGVLFISILGNALVLYGINAYAQNIVRGAVVLAAVLISNWQSKALFAKT
jgi:simple sugar transport system permease protein